VPLGERSPKAGAGGVTLGCPCQPWWPRPVRYRHQDDGVMTMRPRRRDSDGPVVPPAVRALGLPAAPAGAPARRRPARLTRALRTRWWPRFLLAGALLVVIGATLLGGVAATWVMGAGAAIIFTVAFWLLSMSPADYKHEPPMPPGAGAAGS